MKYLRIEKLKSKTYYDPLTILFRANFQILKNFVEKELEIHDLDPKSYIMYDSETKNGIIQVINNAINFYDKVIELYYWYEEYDCDDEEIEDEKLKELIEIRRYLWS